MLTITIPGDEFFDEEKQEFTYSPELVLSLEHSLVSLSKWESIWEKPFLGPGEKTTEEVLSYIENMILTPDIPPGIASKFPEEVIEEINNYINAKMTATWFREVPNAPKSREIITAELLYYWMITARIPLECQHWHLNRLLTLLRVFNEKNSPQKKVKMSGDMLAERNRLNAERKKQLGSNG